MINCSNRQKKYIIQCDIPEGTETIEYRVRIGGGSEIFAGRSNYFGGVFELDCNDWIESYWTKDTDSPASTVYVDFTYTKEDGSVEAVTESLPFDKDTISGEVVEPTDCPYMYLTLHNSDFKIEDEDSGSGWMPNEWNISVNGDNIWNDLDGNTYMAPTSSTTYMLVDGLWVMKNMGKNDAYIADNVWNDGQNVYYSGGAAQYVLNNGIWEDKEWSGFTPFLGRNVWKDGSGNVYYSDGLDEQYKLEDGVWKRMVWYYTLSLMPYDFKGERIWNDSEGNTYCIFYDTSHSMLHSWKLVRGNTWIDWSQQGLDIPSGTFFNPFSICHDAEGRTFYASNGKTHELVGGVWSRRLDWDEVDVKAGYYVWVDPKNRKTYYDKNEFGDAHYVFDGNKTDYDITVPLQVQNGILRGTTRNSLDKVTYMDRYGDTHNGSITNRYFIDCYVDADWLKTLTGNDVNYMKYMLAMQSARKAFLTGTASISGMSMDSPDTMLECRVADVEEVETYSRYNGTHRVPRLKITIEIFG